MSSANSTSSMLSIVNPITGVISKNSYKFCDAFSIEVAPKMVSSYVRLHNFRSHFGSSKVKGMADVRGGGIKPHKQKGLGRARAGSRRSPLWRGGAQIFGGYKPASTYSVNMSKRDRKHAFDMCMSLRIMQENVFVLEDFEFDIKDTKVSKDFLKNFNDRVLVIYDEMFSIDFLLKIRNRPNMFFVTDQFLTSHDLLKYDKILVSKSVFDRWNFSREGSKRGAI